MSERTDPAARDDLEAQIRTLFLRGDNAYGCAETALIVLQREYGLSDAEDSSAAMALNGGVAYSGGICGAVSGAAMAIGRLAGRRIPDHQTAKRTARRLVQRLLAGFDAEFGAHDCATLTGYDLSTEHDAFIADGTWQTTCTRQIAFVVDRVAGLATPARWAAATESRGDAPVAPPDESGRGSP